MGRVLTGIPAGFYSEYAVYVYHRLENHLEGQSDWEMRGVTHDLNAALREARSLYNTRNFRRVEIKLRSCKPLFGKARMNSRTFKVFCAESMAGEGNARWWPLAIFVLATLTIPAFMFLG